MPAIEETSLPGVVIVRPRRFGDARGWFSETWNRRALAEAGIETDFVQDNHSLSRDAGTVRGLHFQSPPHAQAKLVRVLRGAIFDVALDLRRGAPTFGRHVGVTLTADSGDQILVPAGFAHGLMTLEPDTEVLYKVSDYYAPDHDHGLMWNDPDLGIAWPRAQAQAVLSDKDRRQPRFAQFESPFD